MESGRESTRMQEAIMDTQQIKHQVLDYIYDIVGHHEVLEASEKKLRATILNRLPHKIPSYLHHEIESMANDVDGKNFSKLLFSVGIISSIDLAVEPESFRYLKNKAELQGVGRTLFH